MPDYTLSHEETLARFRAGSQRLEQALQGLNEPDFDRCEAPGEWSIRQIVHHLVDDGDLFSSWIKKALASPGAPVRYEGFPGSAEWVDALDFAHRPVGPALALVLAHQHYLTELLVHFPQCWQQKVTRLYPDGRVKGEYSVAQMVEKNAEHLLEHVATIERILEL